MKKGENLGNYYTAREAQERLGIDEGNFYYLIRTGKIKKHIPPGKKQGVYPKHQIDRLAREMLAFMAYDETERVKFMKATHEDIKEEYEMAALMFGNATHDVLTREAWLTKNAETDFIVRDEGKLVAFLNVLPVKHETIMQFINGEIRGWEISANDVLAYEKGSKVECLVMSMGTSPDVNIARRTQYGARLLSGFLQVLEEFTERDIEITALYATSSTPTGIAILKNAGFEQVNHISKRIAFKLDMTNSNSRVAVEYRKILSKHRDLTADLTANSGYNHEESLTPVNKKVRKVSEKSA